MTFIRNTLGRKLMVLYLILFFSSFIFIHTVGTNYIRNKVIEETSDLLHSAGNVILKRHIETQSYTIETIKNFRSHIAIGAETSNCRILIINLDGDILIDTENSSVNDNVYKYDASFLEHRFVTDVQLGTLIKDSSLLTTVPIQNSVLLKGYMVLSTPMTHIESRTAYYFNILDGLFYIIMSVLLIIFILLYCTNIIPLRRLTSAAKEFSIRRDNPPIQIRSNDEYRDLAETLNVIAFEMSRFDEYQKKFIANISHDFRSPLTSINGYAEAIKDGTIPYENQEKYLNIILFEANRLSHLTSNLLDLNTFDKENIEISYTSFDVHQCIQQTADSLEGLAQNKSLTFDLQFPPFSPQMVYADEGKIQQVLHNIMENAVKFSNENSTIDIQTKKKGDKVFISVKDYGKGIPQASLHKVWERFYKMDSSRGLDKKGTGLGLCICKEIIKAHGQKIDVISTEDVGSEFVFTLQKG